jgi:exodeoxyribonuclease-3
MKIATWNINGIRARLDTARNWVKEAMPDILCMQEIKCEDLAFPSEMFEELGYNVRTHGQKGFNGVAILSKLPLEDIRSGLAGDEADTHSRFIEAVVSVRGAALRVVSLYLPNGNPTGTDKFTYKLAWMERLIAYARARLADEEAFLLAGDFNVIPEPIDARFPENWTRDALYQPETRATWRRLVNLGLTDAFRACAPESGHYSFWDYQAGAWQKNNGILIDRILLSPMAADHLAAAWIEKHTRGWDKPSDHVPVVVDLDYAVD